MSRVWEPQCPYVQHEKSSVFCASFVYDPDKCKTCGWNPEEHERRVANLRSGKVKTYLTFNYEKVRDKYDEVQKLKGKEKENDDE